MKLEPARIAKLPKWRIMGKDYPVPYFVSWMKDGKLTFAGDGEPDFRIADAHKMAICFSASKCWCCGEPLGKYKAFVIGPMCSITRTTAEPPNHLDCAIYAVQTCPFMLNPRQKRNEKGKPEEATEPPGEFIERNPGVACVWVTETYNRINVPGGRLVKLGNPASVSWYAEGRPARREEVDRSIDGGFPILLDIAVKEGAASVNELMLMRGLVTKMLEAVP